ncbi:MAG: lipase family protein [Bradyrhizobium sp.]|nr:lipase family protein [Bradyrhizobium sp.]
MNPALPYALLAQKAYRVPPTIGDPDSASRALVEGATVAFRGSDDLDSWLHDLDAITTTTPLGAIHEGFWCAFTDFPPALMELSPQVVCGHSLGAALALIYAGMLTKAGKPPKAVYAFEPPRISADSVLAETLSGVDLFLFRNGLDLVTDLPLGLQLPDILTHIGTPSEPIPNIPDHLIEHVIEALQA